MACAAPRLSPEIMTTRMPRARKVARASDAPGLGSSANAIRARKDKPCPVRSAMAETVAPSACNPVALAGIGCKSTPSSSIQRRLPIKAARIHLALGATPRHGLQLLRCDDGDALLLGSGHYGTGQGVFTATLQAGGNTQHGPHACRIGCRAALLDRGSLASNAPGTSSALRRGRPTVRVPVLSKATTSTLCASSSAWASLIRMPCCAATPVPAMMAAGVASPRRRGRQ
jgi:hypothetical protein